MTEQTQGITFVRDPSSVIEQSQLGNATSQIQYVSLGHCLVIGDSVAALEAAAPLASTGFTVVQVDPTIGATQKQLTETGIAVFTVPTLELTGHMGSYRALVPDAVDPSQQPYDLGVATFRETGCFDLVLDMSDKPIMAMRLLPFGYFHATDDRAISDAVAELVELRGEFEKPRYFNYNSQICAHSRSELKGCSRCIDVCSTGAITSSGEGISVDPFLCQGCGSCATLCPSGAMTYAYPRSSDAIERARQTLNDQKTDTIVLHTESQQPLIDAQKLGTNVTALMVEEVSAFGADFWLAMLAGPANCIALLMDGEQNDPNRLALQSQLEWLQPLLASLGIEELPIYLVRGDQLEGFLLEKAHESLTMVGTLTQRDFSTHNDKRQTLRLALDALAQDLEPVDAAVKLPDHAPFGRINVDVQACTLCMACVSTCPAKALLDGQESPALRFVEANCLQCGLCEAACPESAISLQAQYTWDSIEARKIETLHEEKPFHCMRCHTPFTTQAMIETMTNKLSSHWMFQDEKAVGRLKLCGDCRVKDMFEEDASGISIHREQS